MAHLDASRGDLYDFLAEEVLATLPPELQHFLTRVALLTAVDVASAMLVDDRPADAVAASIAECERLGLLSRPDRESPHRFHPLVREFLVARLTAEIGEEAVRELHRAIGARTCERRDWHASAWHFLAADDDLECAQRVDSAVDEDPRGGPIRRTRISSSIGSAGDPDRPVALILRSRIELARGNYDRAVDLARAATRPAQRHDGMPESTLLNLASILGAAGFESTRPFDRATGASTASSARARRYVAEATSRAMGGQRGRRP